MKRLSNQLLLAGFLAIMFASCKKNDRANEFEISQDVLAKIKAHGFNNNNVQKVNEGYLVEGDILLTDDDLSGPTPSTPNLIIANEEHYRTFNLVNTTQYAIIKVALNNSSKQHQAAFSAALDAAIARYNALNLSVKFQRVTKKPNTTIVSFYQVSNILGSSGFPSQFGSPYPQVQMNTYWYSTATTQTNIDFIATIMCHELGHCIGFRHTDYMNRAYSCGSGGDEGDGGVGAIHIAGTPTGPDADSWMLSCIGSNVNRPFTANDQIALTTVY